MITAKDILGHSLLAPTVPPTPRDDTLHCDPWTRWQAVLIVDLRLAMLICLYISHIQGSPQNFLRGGHLGKRGGAAFEHFKLDIGRLWSSTRYWVCCGLVKSGSS